jgi:PBP1b-binding outer membrane lipoprotein LpoB
MAFLWIGCMSPEGYEMLSHAWDARNLKVNFPRVEKQKLPTSVMTELSSTILFKKID